MNFVCLRFGTPCLFRLHRTMKLEQTECSETSEYKFWTLGNYPEESVQQKTPFILDFKLSPSSVRCILSLGCFPQLMNFVCLRFGTPCLFRLHNTMKLEQTECSETSEYKFWTLGNYPEESVQQKTPFHISSSVLVLLIARELKPPGN